MSDFKNNYMNLLEMATLVENSMKEQAYYLNYFKLLHFVPKAHEIFSSRCVNDENRVMTFNFENGSTIMNFYRWDENQEMFISTEDFSVNLGLYPDYIKQIEWVGKDYVYIEHVAEKSEEVTEHMPDHTHVGELIHFHDDDKFQHSKFLTKGTIFVTSFEIESLNNHCLLFIDFNLDMNILCMDADEEFFVRQRNELEKPVMASVLIISYSPYMVTMRKEEARIAIWKMNDKMEFEIHQTFVEGDPIGVSTISCIHGEFIAVAYGHIPNTMEFGKVIIRRFVRENNDFAIWQTLKLKTPVQIEFALLPSQELVLYVTTENPTEPFNVYIYQGISGFSKKVGDSTLSNILDMNQFTLKNGHFVVLKHYYEIGIIKAVFKDATPVLNMGVIINEENEQIVTSELTKALTSQVSFDSSLPIKQEAQVVLLTETYVPTIAKLYKELLSW
ncbi:hypothetical protein JTB14_036816 [Gonioctena quinquepunctata]|nr:hypothetical protein JTB14_036816 [Gonioctena quinquepunctata]